MTQGTTIHESRIWIDGCFDFFHHGHANAIFQARQHGSELYIGVHSDEEITANKGPTVMNLVEREVAVDANKWTTKTIINAPYVTQPEWMDEYGCKYVVHGDDITTDANGNDCYGIVRDQGRLILVKRTEGVSTTDLINRLLMPEWKEHYVKDIHQKCEENLQLLKNFATAEDGKTTYDDIWYISGDGKLNEVTRAGEKKYGCYVHGTFDLFNPFHITVLKELKQKYGTVLVGVYPDGAPEHTTMDILQRSLCVLQCKYVDGIILGAPLSYEPVIDGKKIEPVLDVKSFENKFDYLKDGGIEKRIQQHHDLYIERQRKKGAKAELEQMMKEAQTA